MAHYYERTSALPNVLAYPRLECGVERIGGFVENQDLRFAE